MTERQLFLLSPYRPPTSYPVSLSSEDASAWLNAYAALWHPVVLKDALMPPMAASAYDHNDPVAGAVYALPGGPSLYLADDWRSRAAEAGAIVFDSTANRAETFAALLNALKTDDTSSPEIVRLFTGIGYGYIMLETLFNAAHHDRLLDLESFWKDIQAAVSGDPRNKLTDAARKLHSAREGLSPGGISFADLIILNDSTLGQPWPCKFSSARPVTLLATSGTLNKLAAGHPGQFAELKAAIPKDLPASVDLAVGAAQERDDALLPLESQLWNIRQALTEVELLFGIPPKLYGRAQSQYHPLLPSWLNQAGFTGMLALNLDGATLPSRYSSVIQWPGPDGKVINAFTRDPLPAHDPATFFNLAYHLHDAINRESNPFVALSHAKPASVSYDDFLALSELASTFGDWHGLERLTSDSHAADYVAVPSGDEFFLDTLDDRVTNRKRHDPVSGFAGHERNRRRLDNAFTFAALHRSLVPSGGEEAALQAKLESVETDFESTGEATGIAKLESAWAAKLSERILARSEPGRPGYLILNPVGSLRRVGLELDAASPIPVGGPVKASDFTNNRATIVVEVPGLGFAWIPRGVSGTVLPKPRMRNADGVTVRNEYLEAEFDPATGAVKAIRDGKLRVTRLGQNLTWNPGSRMIASSVIVTQSNAVLGEITSTGILVDDSGKTVANFTQRARAWMGRPALELHIELRPAEPVNGFPWHNFFSSRFAWRDDRATLFRGLHGMASLTGFHRPQSGDYLEIRFGRERSFLFTGGLPFLQKSGGRMVDCLLAVAGETTTNFEFLIAFDRDYPMPVAQSWLTPPVVLPVEKGPPPTGDSSWLADFDLPSLLLTSLRPTTPSEGFSRAVAARFIETAGFAASSDLRFARKPDAARMIDLTGVQTTPLAITGDAIPMDCSASELFTIHADWN